MNPVRSKKSEISADSPSANQASNGMNREIEELLTRGVGELIDPGEVFRKKLETNPKKIIVKFGIDPTRPDIHLGHAVIFHKLRRLQDLGAKVVFLIGDITAQIGDPTGRSKVRPEVSQDEIKKNMSTYLNQVGKILNTDNAVFSWITNSDWYVNVTDIEPALNAKPTIKIKQGDREIETQIAPNTFLGKAIIYEDSRLQKTHLKMPSIHTTSLIRLLSILRRTTYSRLIQRDLFQDRIHAEGELYMHELMYPILQGIDSDVISLIYGSCDLEIGGTDQTFNMLMGRDIMKMSGHKEQAVLSMKILPGLDGKEKMSKSLDNYIAITDKPNDMYGKVMSIPDSSIENYFELCTFTPMDEVENIRKGLKNNTLHPKEIKMSLAKQIAAIYHGEKAAEEAGKDFTGTFSKGGVPKDIQTVKVGKDKPLVDVFMEQGMVSSKTEFNRLKKEGAIKEIANGIYRIGKHRFLRIEIL